MPSRRPAAIAGSTARAVDRLVASRRAGCPAPRQHGRHARNDCPGSTSGATPPRTGRPTRSATPSATPTARSIDRTAAGWSPRWSPISMPTRPISSRATPFRGPGDGARRRPGPPPRAGRHEPDRVRRPVRRGPSPVPRRTGRPRPPPRPGCRPAGRPVRGCLEPARSPAAAPDRDPPGGELTWDPPSGSRDSPRSWPCCSPCCCSTSGGSGAVASS